MIEDGIAARRQMQMVTALDVERDGISERTKHQIGPGSQCHNDIARDRRAARPTDTPSASILFERSCIAHEKAPALALEQRGVGFGQSTWIGNASWGRELYPR